MKNLGVGTCVVLAVALAAFALSAWGCRSKGAGASGSGGSGACASGSGGSAAGECKVAGTSCPQHCAEQAGCVECLDDGDCESAVKPRCVGFTCQACRDDADCPSGEVCQPYVPDPAFFNPSHCGARCTNSCAPGTFCDPNTGACVGCRGPADCPGQVCDPVVAWCVDCAADSDCGEAAPRCNALGQCVACNIDTDCAPGSSCANQTCTPAGSKPCGSAFVCAADELCVEWCGSNMCAPNTCGTQPLSCDCAPSACPSGCTCAGVDCDGIVCSCPDSCL